MTIVPAHKQGVEVSFKQRTLTEAHDPDSRPSGAAARATVKARVS